VRNNRSTFVIHVCSPIRRSRATSADAVQHPDHEQRPRNPGCPDYQAPMAGGPSTPHCGGRRPRRRTRFLAAGYLTASASKRNLHHPCPDGSVGVNVFVAADRPRSPSRCRSSRRGLRGEAEARGRARSAPALTTTGSRRRSTCCVGTRRLPVSFTFGCAGAAIEQLTRPVGGVADRDLGRRGTPGRLRRADA